MDTSKTVYEPAQHENQHQHCNLEEETHPKRNLIIKNRNLHVNLKGTYIEVNDGVLSQIYGVFQLKALYMHKDIALNLATAYELSRYIKLYFIDARGTILAQYKRKNHI